MNLLLKFHLMQVVLSGELPTTTFALEGHLTLTKRCYQTKLLMYMASTIRALINDLFHSISGNWAWAEDKNIWITASYIPGKENYHAKKKKTELEWMLNQNIFTNIISKFGFQPEVDLFTSRLNAQIPLLVSYHPNPEAIYINAFSIPWQEMHRPFHEFTHFAVIRRV